MNRSTVLALPIAGLLVLAGLAGCLGAASPEADIEPDTSDGNATQVPQPNSRDPVPLPLPALPENLSADGAGEFVAAYEEVEMHNELLREVEANVVELGTSCTVESVDEDDDAYRVVVECGHWYEFESGTTHGIADGAPYRTSYVVTADAVEQTSERRPVY